MRSHQDIIDRLAQYRNHTIHIPPINGKMVTEKMLLYWDNIKPQLIKYSNLNTNATLTHQLKRRDMPHDPKGESFVKYLEYSYYHLKQDDFKLIFGNTSSFGFYSNKPMVINFSLDYSHSDEHQFGIYAPLTAPDNLIQQLDLRSMDHTIDELVELGNLLLEVFTQD